MSKKDLHLKASQTFLGDVLKLEAVRSPWGRRRVSPQAYYVTPANVGGAASG